MKPLLVVCATLMLFTACRKESKDKDFVCMLPASSCLYQKAYMLYQQAKTQKLKGYAMDEYEFNGRKVYVVTGPDNIVDGQSPIYDAACNEICRIGGIAGAMNCEGIRFDANAVLVRNVWKF